MASDGYSSVSGLSFLYIIEWGMTMASDDYSSVSGLSFLSVIVEWRMTMASGGYPLCQACPFCPSSNGEWPCLLVALS